MLYSLLLVNLSSTLVFQSAILTGHPQDVKKNRGGDGL